VRKPVRGGPLRLDPAGVERGPSDVGSPAAMRSSTDAAVETQHGWCRRRGRGREVQPAPTTSLGSPPRPKAMVVRCALGEGFRGPSLGDVGEKRPACIALTRTVGANARANPSVRVFQSRFRCGVGQLVRVRAIAADGRDVENQPS